MLDIKFIRENPDLIKENIKKKFQKNKLSLVDDLLKLDKNFRENKVKVDKLRHERNKISEEINKSKKQGKSAKDLIKKASDISNKIKKLEENIDKDNKKIKTIQNQIPNIIHKSVPIGEDESKNKVIRKEGKIPKFTFKIKNHVELLEEKKLVDFDASAKISGNGFYFLRNELGLLNQALISFTIDHMLKKKYTYIEPPLMVRKEVLDAAMNTEEFKGSIYSIKDENLHMIGTSEHSLLGMHKNDNFNEKELPKKYFSYSMCFRKEIGSHGINEKGLWRTHQFNKVEQFIFCSKEDSYKYYEELMKNSEEIYKKLKLPYRILDMCSGDLADWKSKSCDIEVYRPTTKEYEEVGSLSNCTDYQSRDLNIKYVNNKGERNVVHTLNNTAIATSRAMVAIIENYQQKDGTIKVPTVLQKYMNGIKVIGKNK